MHIERSPGPSSGPSRASRGQVVAPPLGADSDEGHRAAPSAEAPSLRRTLYRFWFWGWLLEPVMHGDPLQREAAYRRNRERARWLAVYAKRWTLLTLACAWVASGPAGLLSDWGQALAWLPGALSVEMLVYTLSVWACLRWVP